MCFLNLDLFKLPRSQLLSTAKQSQKNVFNIEAEMNLVPEGGNLWEKKYGEYRAHRDYGARSGFLFWWWNRQ